MQPCPECDFLLEADDDECKFCGTQAGEGTPEDDRAAAVVATGFDDEQAVQAAEAALADELGQDPAAPEPPAPGTSLELASSAVVDRVALGAVAAEMPYLDEATSPATSRSTKVVAGAIVAVSLALAGVGWLTLGGDDHPASTGPVTNAIPAVPGQASAGASSTTVAAVASTTSLLPKASLGGRTVAIGWAGEFDATMPAGATQTSSQQASAAWSAALPGGSSLTFTVRRASSVADRYRNSIGRLDVLRYAKQVDADLGVTGTRRSDEAFPAGPGAEWGIVGGGRVSVVDAGELVFVVALRHHGDVLPRTDFAAYLAVVASIRTP
jgi:hypothetical protein